jgi:serine/threonine-protein kinase SRPK3
MGLGMPRSFFSAFVLPVAFAPQEGEDWSLEEDHLAKMLELTGERFSPAMLERAQRRSEYLDEQGE